VVVGGRREVGVEENFSAPAPNPLQGNGSVYEETARRKARATHACRQQRMLVEMSIPETRLVEMFLVVSQHTLCPTVRRATGVAIRIRMNRGSGRRVGRSNQTNRVTTIRSTTRRARN